MDMEVLLLAKSKKYNGYCVAGVNVKNNKWVRLCLPGLKSFPIDKFKYQDGSVPNLLDTMVVDVLSEQGTVLHPEDLVISERINKSNVNYRQCLMQRLEHDQKEHKYIFYNQNYKLDADNFPDVGDEGHYSLLVIKPSDFCVIKTDNKRYYASFKYGNVEYTHLSVTDLNFLDKCIHFEDGSTLYPNQKLLIVISLGEVYFNKYTGKNENYKLIASLIPLEKLPLEFNIHSLKIRPTKIQSKDIEIAAGSTPGMAYFNNFEELKLLLQSELQVFNNTEYSIDNLYQAEIDCKVLKAVKKKLTDKKKELLNAYTMPINDVVAQIDELINMIKVPYDVIDRVIKNNAKEKKEKEIMDYARIKSYMLEDYAERVIYSSAFFNPRWKNISYSKTQWKNDVDTKITNALNDIKSIVSRYPQCVNAALSFYFSKLSMDGMENFIKGLENENSPNKKTTTDLITPNNNLKDEDAVQVKICLYGEKEKIKSYLSCAKNFNVEIIGTPIIVNKNQ